MSEKPQAPCEIESVSYSLVEDGTEIYHVPDLLVPVRHQHLFLMKSSDGDHYAVCSVVIEMMINRGTFYAAEVACQYRTVIRIPFCYELRIYSPEIKPAYYPDESHNHQSGHGCEFIKKFIHTAGGNFTFSGFSDVTHDLTAERIYGVIILRDQKHESFIGTVGKSYLCNETKNIKQNVYGYDFNYSRLCRNVYEGNG